MPKKKAAASPPPAHIRYLLRLVERDLYEARDNLSRARSANRYYAADKQWGESGRTLGQIISGYEDWEAEALAAREWLQKVAEE